MSNKVQGLVWDIEFPNAIAKIIALKIADNAHDDGSHIFPSNATIARMAGCARSTVCKYLYAMEHCGLLQVTERSAGGNMTDTTARAYDMALLRRLARPDKATDPELMLVETVVERPARDKKDGSALVSESGSPKTVKVTLFEVKPYVPPVRASDGVPVRETDGSEDHPSAGRTAPVRQTDSTRPPDGHEPFIEPFIEPLPPTPQGAQGGGVKFDWIEALRAEGCAPVVLDEFLLPLLAAGLKPWRDCDPAGPARQLCDDFKRRSPEVLRDAVSRILDTAKHRLPPIADARAAVSAAGAHAAAVALRERQQAGSVEPEIIRFDRGTPEFAAELAAAKQQDPAWAKQIEDRGFVRLNNPRRAS